MATTTPALPVDPDTLDDDTLAALVSACDEVQHRRANLRTIPSQVVGYVGTYVRSGGDADAIVAAINDWKESQ